jgi:outer membrane cobalamin receptor
MQRAWNVGVSMMYVNLIGFTGGWLSMLGRDMAGSPVTAAEPVRLDPVVVTGTQVAVPVSELPSAVTVIDREEIESRQVTDVQELLRTVPGLSVRQTGSRGALTNVFPRGGEADFNLVLINGVPVNNAGGEFDFSDVTTENIERIEIIRGPQSALYGSYAIGSAIQIFTRRGRGPLQGEVSLTGGSFNTVEGQGVVSGGSERFGRSLGLGYVSTSERRTTSFIANVVGPTLDRDFTRPGAPRVMLPGHTRLDLAASYVVAPHLWSLRNVRLQMKIENLLDEGDEEALGFSSPGMSVRGGVSVNF